jgi:hypothetical protein
VTSETTIYPKWQTSLKRHRSSAKGYVERQWTQCIANLCTYTENGVFPLNCPLAEVVPPFESWENTDLYLNTMIASYCFYISYYLAQVSRGGKISDLGNSFLYGYLAHQIHSYMLYQHSKRFGSLKSSSSLEWSIPQITFGYLLNEDERANRMARLAIKDFHVGRMRYRQYPVFTFILALLADYLDEAPVEFMGKASGATALQQLVSVWREPNPDDIRVLCLAACDIHTQRCRIDTAKEYFEFDSLYLYEWPIAINLLFKLREKLGLQNPDLDHPLMNSPLGKLPEVVPFEYDPLLLQVIERMKSQGFDEEKVFETVYYEK